MIDSFLNTLLNYCLKIVPESGFIQALTHRASKGMPWFKGSFIAKAIKGSSIAAVLCLRFNGEAVHVYYQDTNLHIREQIWSPDVLRWVSGEHLFTNAFMYVELNTEL